MSVHDGIWTTDRARSATRWQAVHPDLADGLAALLAWSDGSEPATREGLAHHLATTVAAIAEQFTATIGPWTPPAWSGPRSPS